MLSEHTAGALEGCRSYARSPAKQIYAVGATIVKSFSAPTVLDFASTRIKVHDAAPGHVETTIQQIELSARSGNQHRTRTRRERVLIQMSLAAVGGVVLDLPHVTHDGVRPRRDAHFQRAARFRLAKGAIQARGASDRAHEWMRSV